MKKRLIRFVMIALLIFLAYEVFDCFRYIGKLFYNRAELKYLGTAKGTESTRFDSPEFWLSFNYLYCGNGYHFFDSVKRYEDLEKETNFHDLDFELVI